MSLTSGTRNTNFLNILGGNSSKMGVESDNSPMMVVESFGDHSGRDNSGSSKDLSFGKKS